MDTQASTSISFSTTSSPPIFVQSSASPSIVSANTPFNLPALETINSSESFIILTCRSMSTCDLSIETSLSNQFHMKVVVLSSVRSGTSVLLASVNWIREGKGDAPKPDSYSASSLLFNSSNSICSVNFALPALLSAASSAIRGSFLVMKTSSTRALREGSDNGLGDEMACRKNIGRNTATSAHHPTKRRNGGDCHLHLLEASSLRAFAAPLSLCSRRLTRMSWSAVYQLVPEF